MTDGENVYAFFGGYGLLSYGPDGNERWRKPMGPFTNFHGMGASPILADGKLLMVVDQDIDAYMIAVQHGRRQRRMENGTSGHGPQLFDAGGAPARGRPDGADCSRFLPNGEL